MKDDNKSGQRFLISELERQIAELKKELYEKQQNRYHCQYLFRHNPLGMLTADKTGLIAAANPAFLKSFGLSEQAVIGKSKIQSLPALKEAHISPYLNELLNNEKDFDIESLLNVAASGKKAWFRIRGRATGTEGDSFILIFGNITDRKLNEEKLKESEQRYRTLIEKTPDGIVAHCDGKIVFINPAAIKIGGGKSENPLPSLFTRIHFLLLEVSISKRAVVKYHLDKNLPAVDADITQIRQVIMNLILNASEAIGDKSGIITLTTGAMEFDSAYLQSTYLNYELKEGLYVYLEGCDRRFCGQRLSGLFAKTVQSVGSYCQSAQSIRKKINLCFFISLFSAGRANLQSWPPPGFDSACLYLLLSAHRVRPINLLHDP